MARRKIAGYLAVAAVIGGVAVATISESGSEPLKADSGGGAIAPSSPPPAPYAISTLDPVGNAAQDPGGGGGGTGEPGTVGGPGIQGAQGPGSPQGPGGNDGRLYLSGPNLLDPSRAATTSGSTMVPNPLTGVGGITDELPILGGGASSSTGCADDADEVDYYAIPLKIETVGFTGTPTVRIRITDGPAVSVTLAQMSLNGDCQTIATGTGPVRNGVAEFSLSSTGPFQFRKNFIPALVIKASGSRTITTDNANPSFVGLPGLYGV